MKKSLVALAVLAASGASFAQSSVTLYGIADIWFGNVKTDAGNAGAPTSSITQVTSGGVDTSRWGLKGSEDLGGGLKANFKLEQGFSLDTGAAAAGFNRVAQVGFSGGFGEVKLGKVSSAYNDLEAAAAAGFGSGALGPVAIAFQSDASYTSRPSNTIYYAMPTLSGFDAMVSYSFDEKAAGGMEVVSLGVSYSAGPVFAGLGYQTEQAVGSAVEAKYTQANVTYDMGVAKLLGAYGNVTNDAGVSGNDVSEWQIGVDVPVSTALTVSTGYAKSTRSFTVGADDKVTAFSVVGAYALSKRTYLYGGFATSTVDSTDVKTDRYAVGINHKF
ncbi:MAG: porin [Comamonadaceae bacterium CG17_big_fil_post_rev_8_21_14_2_50_60_13]|nr:MAG: porin [Comamonadaceae bacterium CG17_big_fil_post_rev_8_21_14_2_50_60_13]